MVERGAVPIHRRMAGGTILREIDGLVRRIVGAVVVGLVAVPAGRAGQAVVTVHMALCALQARVRARQGEAGGGMIENCARPVERRGAVTQRAVLWEPRGFMRRIGRAVVVGEMTTDAGRTGQVEIVIRMARRTALAGVEPH